MSIFTKKQDGAVGLVEQARGAIPDLGALDGPGKPIHDAARLRQRLEAVKKKVLAELATCTGPGDLGPKVKFDPGADAAAILNGTDPETLVAPVQETRRGSLLRQLRGLERALPQVEDKPRQLESEIIPKICEDLRPIAQKIVQQTIDAAEALLAAVRTEAQFHELLRIRGVREDMRPGYMREWPQMTSWLHADRCWPSLERFIELRREAAGLPAPEKE